VDLYSPSLQNASNVLPLPVSRCWSPQANQTARHQQTLRDHVIRVGVSRDMPVYSPGNAGYSFRLRLSRPGCPVPRRGGLPVQRWSLAWALTSHSYRRCRRTKYVSHVRVHPSVSWTVNYMDYHYTAVTELKDSSTSPAVVFFGWVAAVKMTAQVILANTSSE